MAQVTKISKGIERYKKSQKRAKKDQKGQYISVFCFPPNLQNIITPKPSELEN